MMVIFYTSTSTKFITPIQLTDASPGDQDNQGNQITHRISNTLEESHPPSPSETPALHQTKEAIVLSSDDSNQGTH